MYGLENPLLYVNFDLLKAPHHLLDPVVLKDLLTNLSETSNVTVLEMVVFLVLSAITYYRKELSCNRVYMRPSMQQEQLFSEPFTHLANQVVEIQMPKPIVMLSHAYQELQHHLNKVKGVALDSPNHQINEEDHFLTDSPADISCQVNITPTYLCRYDVMKI